MMSILLLQLIAAMDPSAPPPVSIPATRPPFPWKGLLRLLGISLLFGILLVFLTWRCPSTPEAPLPPDFVENPAPFILLACFIFMIAVVIGVFLHLAAHMVAARTVGLKVHCIRLGRGVRIGRFVLGGVPWIIHATLMNSDIFVRIDSPQWARLKLSLTYAAGPLAVLFFAAIPFVLLINASPLEAEPPYLWAILVGWMGGSLYDLPFTCIPFAYAEGGQRKETDMRRVFSIFSLTDKEIRSTVDYSKVISFVENPNGFPSSHPSSCGRADRPPVHDDPYAKFFYDMSITADQAYATFLSNSHDWFLLETLWKILSHRRDPRTVEVSRFLVDLKPSSPKRRREWLAGYLTDCVLFDTTGRVPDIERLSEELLAMAPDDLVLRGTYACVLVDLGRLDEGEAILREVLTLDEPKNHGYLHVSLALAARQRGNLDLAREHALKASQSPPDMALMRIADLLPDKPGDQGEAKTSS